MTDLSTIKVGGQLHARAAVTPEEWPHVPTGYEAGTTWRGDTHCPYRMSSPQPAAVPTAPLRLQPPQQILAPSTRRAHLLQFGP
jgi:hypothetical protein